MYEIPVYKAERDLGLAEKIRSSASFTYASLVEPGPEFEELSKSRLSEISDGVFKAKAFVEGHMNLKFLKTILVSTGWNKNDDVFDRGEVWAARATPEDQPLNIEHDCTRIRGHITDNYPVNEAMEKLADDVAVDELPDKFHIITGSVLYKHYEKPEIKEEMEKIFAEIDDGKWYVSMEALFRGFDYATVDTEGNHHVIARSEDSAFLTKHLRAYGGEGTFEGWKVGRMMRHITFSGKGLVKKPANPDSVILATSSIFKPAPIKNIFQISGKSVYLTLSNKSSLQERPMANENTQVQATDHRDEEIRNLKAELAGVKTANEKAVNEKLVSLEAQLKAKGDELTAAQTKVAEGEKALATAKTQLEETVSKLAKVESDQRKTARVAAIAKSLTTTDERATSLHDTLYKNLSDEDFTAALEIQAADYEATKKAAYEAAKTPVNSPAAAPAAGTTAKPANGPGNKKVGTVVLNPKGGRTNVATPPASVVKVASSETETGATNANEAALENATIETEAALATEADSTVNSEVESTRAEIADFFTATSAGRNRRGRAANDQNEE